MRLGYKEKLLGEVESLKTASGEMSRLVVKRVKYSLRETDNRLRRLKNSLNNHTHHHHKKPSLAPQVAPLEPKSAHLAGPKYRPRAATCLRRNKLNGHLPAAKLEPSPGSLSLEIKNHHQDNALTLDHTNNYSTNKPTHLTTSAVRGHITKRDLGTSLLIKPSHHTAASLARAPSPRT